MKRFDKINRSIRLIVLCLLSYTVNGQSWTTDTIEFGDKIFLTELPDNFKRQIDNYTEGVFINYLFPDTSTFSIFYGYNGTISLYRQLEFDTLSVKTNIYEGTIGKTGKYWKAYKHSDELIFWYNLVNREELNVFQRIFMSFKWKSKISGG